MTSRSSCVPIRWSFLLLIAFFFFKQKTAYEMRISDWSSDVCSSDLRAAISDETNAVMRDSGLAHLLSISGLHIGLVAGIAFTGLRLLLSLSETIALRHPIKKWAAVAALLVTFFYTMMVGAPVPTPPSFLMPGLVLLARVLDRAAPPQTPG